MSRLLSIRSARWLYMLLFLLVVLGITACGNASNEEKGTKEPKKALEKIRIGYLNVMDDAQVMLANDAGLYEKNGLQVELQQFTSGTDLIKAIVGGQLDGGVLGFTNALTWAIQGADLKVVGGAQIGYHSMLVRNDSGIQSLADLKGKNVASQKQGSTADILLNGITLPEAGLTRDDVNLVYVSPSVAIQSLTAGKVDAAFVFEPYDSIARLTAPVTPIYEAGESWPFPCMVVISSGKIWKEKQEIVYRMLDAQKEAIEMLENNPQEAADLLTNRFIEGETLDTPNGSVEATEVIKDAIDRQTFNWEITPDQIERMQQVADIMVEQGVLQQKLNVDNILDLSWQEKNKE